MIEVSIDDFMREHPVGEPREFQQLSNRWLRGLMSNPRAPRLKVGVASIDVFDALRSEILRRAGNAMREASLLDALRRRYPNDRVRVTGSSVTPELKQLANALGARWLSVPGTARLARSRQIAWTARAAAQRMLAVEVLPAAKPFMLAVPRMPGHLADMKPVALNLAGRAVSTGFVGPALEARIRGEGLSLVTLGGAAMRRAVLEAPRLALRCAAVGRETAAPKGFNPTAVNWALRQVLLGNALELTWFAVAFGTLLKDARPRVTLVGNPYTMEGRLAARLSRAHRIPSACIEHGSIFANDPIWSDCPIDRVLAWGEPSRRALLSCGVAAKSVRVVGSPRLDRFTLVEAQDRPRTVLVATSGPGDQVSLDGHLRFIDTLFSAAAALHGVEVVVKLHPKDSPSHYAAAQAQHPAANVQLVRGNRSREGVDIFEFLSHARAMVTVTSTAALDAMAVGVPVVAVLDGPPEQYAHIEFLVRGCTTRVRTSAELKAALEDALDGKASPATEEAARVYASEHYANRGDAAARAADELMKLAETGRANA